MALDASRLQGTIEDNIRSALSLGVTPYPQLTAFSGALATAIVNEIKSFAEIKMGKAQGYTEIQEPFGMGGDHRHEIDDVPVTGGID